MSDFFNNIGHLINKNPDWDLFEKNYDKHFADKHRAIPKIIHQIWLGGPLPEKNRLLALGWRNIHPGWEYKLWTDDDVESFGMVNKALFDVMENKAAKSDIFRYEILYRHGGIYIDTDFLCIKPFDGFLHLDFFSGCGHNTNPQTYNGLFGARPSHPILKNVIDKLSKVPLKDVKDFTEILKVCSDVFSDTAIDYMKTSDDRVVVFPSNYFYPFPAIERHDKGVRDCTNFSKALSYKKDKTYCIHLWHTSWQEEGGARKNTKATNKWKLQVPKIFHCYWGGERMPYIRYMTIKSFMDQNPDWQIMFWYPKYLFTKLTWRTDELQYKVTCEDYLPELMKLPIKMNEVDFLDFGFRNNVAETYKSDLLRLHLLNICGGVWSDTDIIYFKPMISLAVNTPENKDKETFVCMGGYGHSIGFLMAAQGSRFFERLSAIAVKEYNENNYQSIGVDMYNKYYPNLESINRFSPAVNLSMDVVYAHDANHIAEILNGTLPRFTIGSIGCHWYAGHPLWGKFMADTNGGQTNLTNSIIGNLLKNAIGEK